ncbi:MAG: hypothetical protein V1696_00030 [Candidatus Jorgensenbacteria bacterium]
MLAEDLKPEAAAVAKIASRALDAIQRFQSGDMDQKSEEMTALSDTEEQLEETRSSIEAVGRLNKHLPQSQNWNISKVHVLTSLKWHLMVRRYMGKELDTVHSLLREIRAWETILRNVELESPLDKGETEELEKLKQFLEKSVELAELIGRGELSLEIDVDPMKIRS